MARTINSKTVTTANGQQKSGQIALPAQMIIKDMNYSLIIDICDNNALDIKGLGCTARFSDSYNNLS